MQSRVLLLLTLLLLVSLTSAGRDRWVWLSHRSGRQLGLDLDLDLDLPAPPPLPSDRGRFLDPLSSEGPRSLGGPNPLHHPSPLVIRPLAIDISTLPLETQDSDNSFDLLESPSSRQRLPQNVNHGEGLLSSPTNHHHQVPVLDLSRAHSHALPAVATISGLSRSHTGGHLEALVSTPDISKLPLQSEPDSSGFSLSTSSFPSSSSSSSFPSSSSSFPSSSFFSSYSSFLSPDNAVSDVEEVVFPQRFGAANSRPVSVGGLSPQPLATHPPPSFTPQPSRVFLPRLDDSSFLTADEVREKQVFKSLEALQKEALAQNSRQFDLAFQNIGDQFARELNDIHGEANAPLVFPVLARNHGLGIKKPATVEQPPPFTPSPKAPVFGFPSPLTRPHPHHQRPTFLAADQSFKPLRVIPTKRAARTGIKLTRSDGNLRKERRSSSPFVWVWPRQPRHSIAL